jgi:hypothetical protein
MSSAYKEQILSRLSELSDESAIDLLRYMEYVRLTEQSKAAVRTAYRPVVLGGLWQGQNVSEEDLSGVRREMWGSLGEE